MKKLLILLLISGCAEADVQDKILSYFKDPDSVKVREFTTNGKSACIFANAKNGFGAYTGYQAYLANVADNWEPTAMGDWFSECPKYDKM